MTYLKLYLNIIFCFCPTKNENFGHAIVETLSCGRPVLISNCTPWKEVNEYQCGYALPLDENIFAERLLEILSMDDDTFQKMCVNAHSFIAQKMNIENIKAEYLKMFEYAANSRKKRICQSILIKNIIRVIS
ncbi:MAG: hypothetical protein KatS3mg028_0642 [Bacteroidia bacterium]|nr:MAG: hypothetical protein KatS3mg028_0642 [Bacteroidia bacterium]